MRVFSVEIIVEREAYLAGTFTIDEETFAVDKNILEFLCDIRYLAGSTDLSIFKHGNEEERDIYFEVFCGTEIILVCCQIACY